MNDELNNQDRSKPPQPLASGKSKSSLWIMAGVIIVLIVGITLFAFNNKAEPAPESQDNTFEAGRDIEDIDDTIEINESDLEVLEQSSPPVPAEGASESDSAVKTFEITGSNFEFSKTEIRVNQGDTVRIVFSSAEGFHDWVIDEFNAAAEQVNTGGTSEVEFVADQTGTFEYYCSVGAHRQQGMVGRLIVE